MPSNKQRQALAVSSRLSSQTLPGYPAGAIKALEEAASRITSQESVKEGGGDHIVQGHVVIDGGRLSGFVKDAHTTVRFSGGSVAVTTHD
jgi:hypothetical protein